MYPLPLCASLSKEKNVYKKENNNTKSLKRSGTLNLVEKENNVKKSVKRKCINGFSTLNFNGDKASENQSVDLPATKILYLPEKPTRSNVNSMKRSRLNRPIILEENDCVIQFGNIKSEDLSLSFELNDKFNLSSEINFSPEYSNYIESSSTNNEGYDIPSGNSRLCIVPSIGIPTPVIDLTCDEVQKEKDLLYLEEKGSSESSFQNVSLHRTQSRFVKSFLLDSHLSVCQTSQSSISSAHLEEKDYPETKVKKPVRILKNLCKPPIFPIGKDVEQSRKEKPTRPNENSMKRSRSFRPINKGNDIPGGNSRLCKVPSIGIPTPVIDLTCDEVQKEKDVLDLEEKCSLESSFQNVSFQRTQSRFLKSHLVDSHLSVCQISRSNSICSAHLEEKDYPETKVKKPERILENLRKTPIFPIGKEVEQCRKDIMAATGTAATGTAAQSFYVDCTAIIPDLLDRLKNLADSRKKIAKEQEIEVQLLVERAKSARERAQIALANYKCKKLHNKKNTGLNAEWIKLLNEPIRCMKRLADSTEKVAQMMEEDVERAILRAEMARINAERALESYNRSKFYSKNPKAAFSMVI